MASKSQAVRCNHFPDVISHVEINVHHCVWSIVVQKLGYISSSDVDIDLEDALMLFPSILGG